jgi:anti-sigma factor RsiW
MRCNDCQENMSRSLDGRLDKESQAALDAHVAACADCTKEMAVLRGTAHALRSIGRAEPPAGLARRAALAAFRAQKEGKTSRVSSWWSDLFRFAWPAAAASAVAAASLMVVANVRGVDGGIATDPAAVISIDRDAVTASSLSSALGEEVD